MGGGWSKTLSELEREQIEEWAHELIDLSKLTLKVFGDVILSNPAYMELVTGDMYKVPVNYMGSVDENNMVALYDGTQKVVDVNGNDLYSYNGLEYIDYISERVLPWTYLKMPYQKKIGWKGIVDGDGTSLYSVGPLARFNVADGLSTPLANEEFKTFFNTFGISLRYFFVF